MPLIPEIFHMAAAEEQDGTDISSQDVSTIPGHATAAATSAQAWCCAVCDGPHLRSLTGPLL